MNPTAPTILPAIIPVMLDFECDKVDNDEAELVGERDDAEAPVEVGTVLAKQKVSVPLATKNVFDRLVEFEAKTASTTYHPSGTSTGFQ